jgi:two-component system response regulator NreC
MSSVAAVSSDKSFFSAGISSILLESYRESPRMTRTEVLTSREREIIQLLAEGESNKAIASALGISVKTAETHRSNTLRKLGLHSLPQLIRYAVRNGFVEP